MMTMQRTATTAGGTCSSTTFLTRLATSVWPGLGLLGESYLLFSLGTLQPLLATFGVVPMVLPLILGVMGGMIGFGVAGSFIGRRWGSISTATLMWMGSIGMYVTSLLVVVDVSVDPEQPQQQQQQPNDSGKLINAVFGTSLCILGLGVGGEYPMAAASASEQQQQQQSPEPHQHHHHGHGQQVQLVFSMQGMGILLHCLLLYTLLLILGDQESAALLLVWRILYLIGVVLLSIVLTTRIWHLQESPMWAADQKRAAAAAAANKEMIELGVQPGGGGVGQLTTNEKGREQDSMAAPYPIVPTVSSLSVPSVAVSPDGSAVYHIHNERVERPAVTNTTTTTPVTSLSAHSDHATTAATTVVRVGGVVVPHYRQWGLAWHLYGSRLVGVSLSWCVWDVAFYGNKLFQSAFLLAITGTDTTTLTQGAAAATLNAAVAAAGYLTAAAVMDQIGHWRLQLLGFILTGLLFLSTGFFLDKLAVVADPAAAKTGLILLYLGTSYFGQVGPNATTFVLPAEVMPTAWRTLGHGLAAASGKLGALLATLLFHSHSRNDDPSSSNNDSSNDNSNNHAAANLFLWSGYASLLGAVITYWLVPYETSLATTANHSQLLSPQHNDDLSLSSTPLSQLDTNWHRAVAGQPYIVPADSVYERLLAQRRKVEADGNYLTSDIHDAVYG